MTASQVADLVGVSDGDLEARLRSLLDADARLHRAADGTRLRGLHWWRLPWAGWLAIGIFVVDSMGIWRRLAPRRAASDGKSRPQRQLLLDGRNGRGQRPVASIVTHSAGAQWSQRSQRIIFDGLEAGRLRNKPARRRARGPGRCRGGGCRRGGSGDGRPRVVVGLRRRALLRCAGTGVCPRIFHYVELRPFETGSQSSSG